MHETTRRQLVAALALATLGPPALAQADKPIRFVLPNATGSGVDAITRAAQPALAKALGHPVVVDNQPGAGGVLGLQTLARAAPDGFTLGVVSNNVVIFPSVIKQLPFDMPGDFTPIAVVGQTPIVLVANAKVPAANSKEFVALLKSKPDQLNYASGGIGTIGHLSAELLQQAAGVKLNHIVYKGSGQAVIDLLGGHVGTMFGGLSAFAAHARSGKIRLIAVTGKTRMPVAPEVPTVAESGYPGFEAVGWFGLIAPARTPAARIARLNQETIKAAQLPAVRERLTAIGFEVVTSTPQEFSRYIRSEALKWRALIRQLGLNTP